MRLLRGFRPIYIVVPEYQNGRVGDVVVDNGVRRYCVLGANKGGENLIDLCTERDVY